MSHYLLLFFAAATCTSAFLSTSILRCNRHLEMINLDIKSINVSSSCKIRRDVVVTNLSSKDTIDDDVSKQLAKAKEVLARAKAKLEKKSNEKKIESKDNKSKKVDDDDSDNKDAAEDKRSQVIKSTDGKTGLITTDGELMAELSEYEQWEMRRFDEQDEETAHQKAMKKRDLEVAQAIFNLRRQLKDGDYERIFDKTNYFIGEDS